jgi:hypothetical protein
MKDPVQVENTLTQSLPIIDTVKWPIVVLIIVLLIRRPITNLINRVTKIGHGNTTVEALQQQVAEQQEKKRISNVAQALGLFRPETVEFFRNAVYTETEIQNLKSDKEKVDHLIDYSTVIYIIKHYESIYNSIFGSQILMLQQLNTLVSEDRQSLRRYYDYAQKLNPQFFDGYSYDQYLEFMFTFNLITDEGGEIKITILGVDFLKYLTESNKSTEKGN